MIDTKKSKEIRHFVKSIISKTQVESLSTFIALLVV